MKKFDSYRWSRPNIRTLVPYSSARDEFSGDDFVFLDANESPFETGLNRYPDPYQMELKERISRLKACSPDQLFLGNGSDEAIDLLFRCFTVPGKDRVLSISPSYGMYKVCADINDVGFDTVLLKEDFSINPDVILSAVRPETKIIFLCSPNNPSGNALDWDSVIKILESYEGLVVVDEAYQDFSESRSFLELLGDYQNLVVLQTFSKAWGMAGVRLGMAMADPSIISYLRKVKYPYNINTLSQVSVLQALDRKEAIYNNIRIIKEQRGIVVEALRKMPGIKKIYPSDANFVLVRMDSAKEVYKSLLDEGVVVRDRSSMPLCEGCLRITIGTEDDNKKMLSALTKFTLNT